MFREIVLAEFAFQLLQLPLAGPVRIPIMILGAAMGIATVIVGRQLIPAAIAIAGEIAFLPVGLAQRAFIIPGVETAIVIIPAARTLLPVPVIAAMIAVSAVNLVLPTASA